VDLPAPFRSPQAFRAAFDAHIHHLLAPRLLRRFDELRERCRTALRRGSTPSDPPDDLLVFLKLVAIGIEDLPTASFRRVGP